MRNASLENKDYMNKVSVSSLLPSMHIGPQFDLEGGGWGYEGGG